MLGMAISALQYTASSIVRTKDSWYLADPSIYSHACEDTISFSDANCEILVPAIPASQLRQLNYVLRIVVRDIFYLPQCTVNGMLYYNKRWGDTVPFG